MKPADINEDVTNSNSLFHGILPFEKSCPDSPIKLEKYSKIKGSFQIHTVLTVLSRKRFSSGNLGTSLCTVLFMILNNIYEIKNLK
jgi:hypothetical protein